MSEETLVLGYPIGDLLDRDMPNLGNDEARPFMEELRGEIDFHYPRVMTLEKESEEDGKEPEVTDPETGGVEEPGKDGEVEEPEVTDPEPETDVEEEE